MDYLSKAIEVLATLLYLTDLYKVA